MEAISVLLAMYVSTWIMIVYRTFWIIHAILELRKERLFTDYKITHFIVYSIGTTILVPFIWTVALFEEPRKKWVRGYCDSITKKGKK